MKQDVDAIGTAYRSRDRADAIDKVARQIVQILNRETQYLNPRVVCRLRNIREAALRLHDLSVSGGVNASPAAREPAIEHDD
jgi:hypothetical protein